MEPGAILLAGGLLAIASFSLLWIQVHLPSKRLKSSSRHVKSVSVGVSSLATGTSNASFSAKKRKSNSSSDQKKSTFKPKKRKSRTTPVPSPVPQIPTTTLNKEDTDEKQLESDTELSSTKSDEEKQFENRERESPTTANAIAESPPQSPQSPQSLTQCWQASHQESASPKDKAVYDNVTCDGEGDVEESYATDEGVTNDGNAESEELLDLNISAATEDATTFAPQPMSPQKEAITKSQSQSQSQPPQPPLSSTTTVSVDQEEDSRKKRRRRRRNRSNISQKSNKVSRTSKDILASMEMNSALSNVSNSPSVHKEYQQPSQVTSEMSKASPTRPPIKVHNFSMYSLDGSLSGSGDRLSTLDTTKSTLGSHKLRKKPIVTSMFRSGGSIRPYVDDTDNDSNVSGQESKTIHDSDSGSRHRTLSEASKRGVSDEELLDEEMRLGDDDEQRAFDSESVMSRSISRTTATSVSELDKCDEDWNEMEESTASLQSAELIPMALPTEEMSILKGKKQPKEKKRNRRRSRSRTKDEEKRSSRKSKSRKNKSESGTDEQSPSPEIPQQFGQHLAYLAHNQQMTSTQVDGDVSNSPHQQPRPVHQHHPQHQQQQQPQQPQPHMPFAFYPSAAPFLVPYPGVVDMNGMPTFVQSPSMLNPLTPSHSAGDLMSLSSSDLIGMNGINWMRSQSDPTGTQMLFPTVFAPPAAGVQMASMPTCWPSATATPVASTPVSVPETSTSAEAYELSGTGNDHDSLYLVASPSGQMSLETNQTLGRSSSGPENSLPALTSTTPGTPSVGRTPEAMPPLTGMGAPPRYVPYPYPQNGLQMPMFAQPIYDPNFLATYSQYMMQHPSMTATSTTNPVQPVLQTIPNSTTQQEFRESVLSAPLYQPTHIPSVSPDDAVVSGIPNPKLHQAASETADTRTY